ncbi:MAG: transposase [Gammaproteobacteria bacterium]|nr:transposase [Gammaproteobacteria bacterium]
MIIRNLRFQTGRLSYPCLTLFRTLLLGTWYRLSDMQLVQCVYRDRLFLPSFAVLSLAERFPRRRL